MMSKHSPLDVAPGRYWAWRHSPQDNHEDLARRVPIGGEDQRIRLAIVSSHPIQYHAPWFRALARQPEIDLHVYYCHRVVAKEQGVGFEVPFEWDVPLLDGYSHTFLNNVAAKPALGKFNGLNTPEISDIILSGAADVVLVNGWHYRSAWQAICACWRSHVPVIARGDSHMHSPRSATRKFVKALPFRAFIPRFSGCAAVGSWSRDYFLHYGAKLERVFVIPHVIDVEWIAREVEKHRQRRVELRTRWNLQSDAVTFLFAGKFVAKKHPVDFVRAIARAAAKGPKVQGLMVGDGPLRATCEAEVNAAAAPITFAGFLNQSEIAAAYSVADALVLPSDGDETWGLVVNEAMACGVPCIVSDRVGCGPDLIGNSGTGDIVPLNDVERLAATMAAWAVDPQRMSEMGAAAGRLSSTFAPDVAARATVMACQGVVTSAQPRHSLARSERTLTARSKQ
jgi:glycosyltransferase involved in cell wall biosynthesis